MPVIEPKLGIPPEIQQGIEAGRLYRDGGVVREGKTGRIVKLLQDVGTEQDTLAECLRPLVPLVLHAAVDSRLLRIEAQLRALAREVVHLSTQVRVADAKLDGLLMGQVLSTLQLVKLHLAVGETERAASLWPELYRDVVQLFTASESLLMQSDLMQRHLAVWRAYTHTCWGAGVLTLDLLIQQGQAGYANIVAHQLAERAESFERQLHQLLARHASSFWISMEHRQALLELREVMRRLLARRDALAQGLFNEVRALGAASPEASAVRDAPVSSAVHAPAG